MWQTFTHVSNPSKKPLNEDTYVSQYFQKEGPKNEELKVVKFDYPVILTRRGNANLDMCHYIEKNRVIILLETNDECKNN